MTLEALIEEVLALDAKATKGRWASEDFGELLLIPDCPSEMDTCWSYDMKKENRDLIAHYRTSAPQLALALKRHIEAVKVAIQCIRHINDDNKDSPNRNLSSYCQVIENDIDRIINGESDE